MFLDQTKFVKQSHTHQRSNTHHPAEIPHNAQWPCRLHALFLCSRSLYPGLSRSIKIYLNIFLWKIKKKIFKNWFRIKIIFIKCSQNWCFCLTVFVLLLLDNSIKKSIKIFCKMKLIQFSKDCRLSL